MLRSPTHIEITASRERAGAAFPVRKAEIAVMDRAGSIISCIVIVAVCAVTIFKGCEFLFFAWTDAQADSYIHTRQDTAGADELTRQVAGWIDVAGLRPEARARLLALHTSQWWKLLNQLDPDVVSLLAVRPMSGAHWLKLSQTRVIRAGSFDSISSAIEISGWMGPREIAIVFERTEFGLQIWEFLNAKVRDRVMAELVAVEREFSWAMANRLRIVLALKSEPVRDDIRTRLRQYGNESEVWLKQLGLQDQR